MAGHTSLSQEKDVLMAGHFEVSGGKITTFSDSSGHYRPNNDLPGYQPIEDVALDALRRNGFPLIDNPVWDPW